MSLSNQSGWDPFDQLSTPTENVGVVFDYFAEHGFHNPQVPSAVAQFAFMPPWTLQPYGGYFGGENLFPSSCYESGGCALPARTFPALPVHDVVPTFA